MHYLLLLIIYFQVRKSFFSELNINDNATVVDLLYQQFYTGSDKNSTPEEQEFMKNLFTSETYVKNEYRYYHITQKGDLKKCLQFTAASQKILKSPGKKTSEIK